MRSTVRDTRWFPAGRGAAASYLSGLLGLPLALVLAGTEPIAAPEPVYGLLVAAAGWPAWAPVCSAAARQGRRAYSLWGLSAQVWLQLGGGTRQALTALRDGGVPQGRHAAGLRRRADVHDLPARPAP